MNRNVKSISEAGFNLSKVKRLNGGGINVKFSNEIKSGEEYHYPQVVLIDTEQQHPDLDEALDRLKEHVVAIVGIAKDRKKDITVTGISMSGDDANEAVIITAKQACAGGTIAINTPRIVVGLNSETGEPRGVYKDEDAVRKILQQIDRETRAYIFDRKRAQLEIPFEAQKEDAA